MKTPFAITARKMLKSWGAEIAILLVGVALLVFLTASFNRAIEGFSSTAGNGSTLDRGQRCDH